MFTFFFQNFKADFNKDTYSLEFTASNDIYLNIQRQKLIDE